MRATEVVQRRLLAAAKPETQAEIRRVLAKVSGEVAASAQPKRDFSAAEKTVRAAAAAGTLDEAMVASFAAAGRYEETVVALAELCDVPLDAIDKMMNGERPDPVLHSLQGGEFFLADGARGHPRASRQPREIDARIGPGVGEFRQALGLDGAARRPLLAGEP